MRRIMTTFLLGAALVAPVVLKADDNNRRVHRYYDRERRDWHRWNASEDRAYHRWLEERHENWEWRQLNREQQYDYWRWRHNHPNRLLFGVEVR